MRTTILTVFLLTLPQISQADSIDWTRLDMEMSYLENAPNPEIKNESLIKSKPSEEELPKLARRSAVQNNKEIPELDSVFDSIKTKLAAPEKREEVTHNDTQKKPKARPVSGVVTKDIYESLVD